MNEVKKLFSIVAFVAMILTATVFTGIKCANATESYTKLEIEDMQLNKARIKKNSGDSNGKHVEVYWQQDPLDKFDKLTDITFARTVLDAEKEGEYELQIHCKNDSGSSSINLKLYVNGIPYDITLTGSEYTTLKTKVKMKKGYNAVVLAWVNWGYFDYISYPEGISTVSKNTENMYYAYEAALNEVQLAPTSEFHNAETTLYTAPIEYNSGDEEWQGSATFKVKAGSDIKSLDLGYYVTSYNGGKAEIAMSVNNNKEIIIDLSGSKVNTELVKSISSKILEDAGFKSGAENTIKFRKASQKAGSVGLYYIKLKKEQVEETTEDKKTAIRYEAEKAYLISGGKIKNQEKDSESWSQKLYVGDFTAASISSSSEIDEYCSNVGFIQYKVKAEKAGYYKVILGYATEIEKMTVYVTSGYEWSKVILQSTGSWDNVGEEDAYVYLNEGENYIWVTGPTKKDDWANYDYIDIVFEKSAIINTKKTVLLLDDGEIDEVSTVEQKDTNSDVEETTDANDSNNQDDDLDLISPKTGVRIYVIMLVMVASGLVALLTINKNKEETK